MNEKKVVPNQSVEKVLAIIEDMSKHDRCRLQDVAKRVDLPASTTLRMINTLCRCGYAAQDSQTYMYYLTMKFAQLGQAIGSRDRLYDVTHPALKKLAERCNESCSVGIEQNGEVVYVDVVDCPDGVLRTTQKIGKIAPLHTTGIGKMLLLNYTEEQLRTFCLRYKLVELTPNSINNADDLIAELDKVRKLGYALDDEECEMGVRCVAMGVRDSTGKTVAGISLSGPIQRMTESQIRKHRTVLAEIVGEIEGKI